MTQRHGWEERAGWELTKVPGSCEGARGRKKMPLSSSKPRRAPLKSPVRGGRPAQPGDDAQRAHHGMGYGLPPMRAPSAGRNLKAQRRETFSPEDLRYRTVRMGAGGKVGVAVFSQGKETLQFRQLAPRVAKDWGKLADGALSQYCRASMVAAGRKRVKGWLGIGPGIVFFLGDGDVAVDVILRPVDIVELTRDDDLATVDVRYSGPGAAVFCLSRSKLDQVVAALVTVCDETRTLESTPVDCEGADARSPPPPPPFGNHRQPPPTFPTPPDRTATGRYVSPPRSSARVCPPPAPPQHDVAATSAQFAAPGAAATAHWTGEPHPVQQRVEFGPVSDEIKAILRRKADAPAKDCNDLKWRRQGTRLGGGVGPDHVRALHALGLRGLRASARKRRPGSKKGVNLVEEIIRCHRFPEGVTASEAVLCQALEVERVGSEAEGELGEGCRSSLEALVLRLVSQEGPDSDRLFGFPDAPPPCQREFLWTDYENHTRGKRNASLLSILCSVISDDLNEVASLSPRRTPSPPRGASPRRPPGCSVPLESLCHTFSYLCSAAEPLPKGTVLFRPCTTDLNTAAQLRRLAPGDTYSWACPAPCTLDRSVAISQLSADPAEAHTNFLFAISGRLGGFAVSRYSQYPMEMEVLLPPLSVFRVVGKQQEDEFCVVMLEGCGSIVGGEREFEDAVKEVLTEVKVDDLMLQSREVSGLAESEEREARGLLHREELLDRRALAKRFYLRDLHNEAQEVLRLSLSRSPPPPPLVSHSPTQLSSPPRVAPVHARASLPANPTPSPPSRSTLAANPSDSLHKFLPSSQSPPRTPHGHDAAQHPGRAGTLSPSFTDNVSPPPSTAAYPSPIETPGTGGAALARPPPAPFPPPETHPVDIDSETGTLTAAAALIREQGDKIKTLQWQLAGVEQIMRESNDSELIAKIEELNQQRSILLAERERKQQDALDIELAAMKRNLLMDTPPDELQGVPVDELRRRLFACQKVNRHLEEERDRKESVVEHACRNRIRNEVETKLELMRESIPTDELEARPSSELARLLKEILLENRLLAERADAASDSRARHWPAIDGGNGTHGKEAGTHDEALVHELRAAVRVELGLPPVPEVDRDILIVKAHPNEPLGIVHDSDDWRLVAAVQENSPAQRAGVEAGCRVKAVNRCSVAAEDGFGQFSAGAAQASFFLTVAQRVDQDPAAMLGFLGAAVNGTRSTIAAGPYGGSINAISDALESNSRAVETVWDAVKQNTEALRQLYLLRQAVCASLRL
ncbi:hypothetical protein DIPPA_28914 [Diplonema papillatum]|nr:hypothetical protein DIPPA_28914 [Diplonema papillatum]